VTFAKVEGLEKLKTKALELAPGHQWDDKWIEAKYNRQARGADSAFTDCLECGACLSVVLYPSEGMPQITLIENGEEISL
jgi:hypothetical protein